MTDTLRHRGPDGRGVHLDGPVGLGHRRLAVIDTSAAGAQPMTIEGDRFWITYNGEIYNYRELRAVLESRGHRFRSQTDTEVILRAFSEWGIDCLAQLNGMFAFALWDATDRRLWLVRDRLGIKPLFFSMQPHRLLFGSEIKSILADPDVERRVDPVALHHFLSLNYTPAPYTLFDSVRQLLPGEYMAVSVDGDARLHQYWDISYSAQSKKPERLLLDEFDAALSAAVERQMVADVPLGAFLSGGVDSSAIVYWMSRHSSQPVSTFSIGFREKSYSELDFARRTADACNTDHHERVVTGDMMEVLPEIVRHAEEPTADSSMLPMYFLSKMARENVTVALSGDGADEILAGYETYQAYYAAKMYRVIPQVLRHHVAQPLVDLLPASHRKVSLDFKLKRFVRAAELAEEDRHAYWRMIFDEDAKRRLYRKDVRQQVEEITTYDIYRNVFAQSDAMHPLDRMLYVDTRFYLPNDMLVKLDRMSMIHSLEARVPYLDHELVEFIARVPPRFKLKQLRTKKYLLKAALRRRLPSASVWRKKQGFNIPKGVWLKGELREFAFDRLSPQRVRRMGLFEEEPVTQLLNDHVRGTHDRSHELWGLLALSMWWEQFFEKARDASPQI